MRNRKRMGLIFGILAAGFLMTAVTDLTIAGARRQLAAEQEIETQDPDAAETAAQAAEPQETGTDGRTAETEEEIRGPGAALAAQSGGVYEEFRKKFRDTEQTLAEIGRNGAGNQSGAVRNSDASAQLRYWETQLNLLYQTIMDTLTDEEAAVLARDQQDWRKQRDETAAAAAKDAAGGPRESSEYMLSQAASTRERAYALLERYKDRLN